MGTDHIPNLLIIDSLVLLRREGGREGMGGGGGGRRGGGGGGGRGRSIYVPAECASPLFSPSDGP